MKSLKEMSLLCTIKTIIKNNGKDKYNQQLYVYTRHKIDVLTQFNSDGAYRRFNELTTENLPLVDISECFTLFPLSLHREQENLSSIS